MGRYTGKKCRLISMLWLTTGFFVVEVVVGYITNSMALVADSFHMLSDVAALAVAFLSVKMSPKKWSKNTFGWARAEVLGALVNAVFLVALCFSITLEAFKRFIEVQKIHDPKLLVVVGTIGLFVNLIGLLLFHEHGSGHTHGGGGGSSAIKNHNRLSHLVTTTDDNENDETFRPPRTLPIQSSDHKHGHSHLGGDAQQMNMRGVFLHVLSDALGSVIVICSATVFWLTDWKYKFYIDPALSILLVLLILHSVWPLLRESALILLQTVPTHIQVDAIQRKLLTKVDGVLAVHEFHVWQLAGDRIIASAHIRCRNLSEYMKIAEKVKEFFHNEGIHSTTIQPEFVELDDYIGVDNSGTVVEKKMTNCAIICPKTDADTCDFSTCCGPAAVEGLNSGGPSDDDETSYNTCRQRNSATVSFNSLSRHHQQQQQMNSHRQTPINEMEEGALLSHHSCTNSLCNCNTLQDIDTKNSTNISTEKISHQRNSSGGGVGISSCDGVNDTGSNNIGSGNSSIESCV